MGVDCGIFLIHHFQSRRVRCNYSSAVVRKNSEVFWDCPLFEEKKKQFESAMAENDEKSDLCKDAVELFSDSVGDENQSSSVSSSNSSSESLSDETSAIAKDCPLEKTSSDGNVDDEPCKLKKKLSVEMDLMKERFSKLLLGEDMSGCGKGVCTALAIANAITNLCATIFGQLWRLEPLSPEKKAMWRREMEWLLCVSDHIVELTPSWQTFPDGTKLEVMTCRPRSDLFINLPALRKLDNMLLEILDCFKDPEFWYVDQGILASDSDGSSSFRKIVPRQEEKWWLPVPRVPPGGLNEKTRKELEHKRECVNQILKAALAINSNALAEMEVPDSYIDSLPKTGRASLGDVIYRYMTSDQFSPECLLDCLDFASEYQALEVANRVEASVYIWRRRAATKSASNASRSSGRAGWGAMKEMIVDADKSELLAERAESLLICLKQRFPGLTQTTLDMSKIQYNKDVGKSILESYSRVLESLAFNIVARIDDLISVDDLTKSSDQLQSLHSVSVVTHKRTTTFPSTVPCSGTPYATAYASPSFSPAPLVSPAKIEKAPFITRKPTSRGFGVKKVLTDYLGVESRGKANNNVLEIPTFLPNTNQDRKNP